MKKRKITVFLIIVILSSACLALNDEIGNPTVPPSSVSSGLIKSPSPVGNTGNLTVTGNVGGMSYFHGDVPYRAPTDIEAPLGTSDISSFLRRSAPINPASSQFTTRPYYLPSRTVGSLGASGAGIPLRYPSIRDNREVEFETPQITKTGKRPEITAASPLYDYSRTRPLSYEPTDLERAMSYDLMREKNKKELSLALQKASRGMYEITEQKDKEQEENMLIPQPAKPAQPAEQIKPLKPLRPGEIVQAEQQKPVKDVYEQMRGEINEPLGLQPAPSPPGEEEKKSEKLLEQTPSEKSSLGEIEKETAQATVDIYKSFATESKDKFNYYMRTAEEFLRQGKYYNAVDAYTLASVYKLDDPLAYAGRSHALFASGEYMSSAYFLARAINIFPQYVNYKVDLHAMIPDANRLESRIEDIKTWIENTESAELSFLLAYIYYQLDKNDLAMEAIKFSAEKMPDVAAVKTLKQAIEKKSR